MTIYYKKRIMAININKVYKSVLSILNKEQRGYLNPYEYNNIAKQVQLEILEKMFYDYNKFLNIEKAGRINESFADIPQKIQEQLDEFYTSSSINLSSGVGTLPTDLYKVIDVTINNQTVEVQKIDKNKLPYLKSSPLTTPSTSFPIYYQRETDFVVDPTSFSSVLMQYVQLPPEPRWGFSTNATYGTQVYDSTLFVETGLINNRNLATLASQFTTNQTGLTNGTYTTFTTSGTGTGATLTLTVTGGTATGLVVGSAGSGYAIGDTLTFNFGSGVDVIYTIKAGDTFGTSTRGSTDFKLHASQESELIIGILAYAGFVVKNAEVFQGAIQLGQGAQITKQQQ